MKNPDFYLREAYITGLQAAGLNAYNEFIPINLNPIPTEYVLVTSQTKTPTARTKEDFEWNSRITLNIVKVNRFGASDITTVNAMEETCINMIEAGVIVPNFIVKSTYLIDSLPLNLNDKITSITRQVLLYEHWLCEMPTSPAPDPGSTVDFSFEDLVAAPLINHDYNILRPNDYIPVLTDTSININGSSDTNTGQIQLDYLTGTEVVQFNGVNNFTPPGVPGILTVSFVNSQGDLTFS